jgi:hypothetical protein
VKFAHEITAEEREEFLSLIYEGFRPDQAAKELGSTGTQFRKFASARSQYHDPEFAEKLREALASDEHQRAYLERIRDARANLVDQGNVRMIEKESYAHDPLWATLRHQNLNVNVDILARTLPGLSLDELERIREALEKEKEPETIDVPAPLRALSSGE